MASILERLDSLGDEHPHKLLYSFIDLNGNAIESYTYASFLRRTKAIASHLLKEGRFAAQDRLLLAYPPGLEMICAFFGCVRAGLIPVPVYPPSSRGFQSSLFKMVHIAKDCQAAGTLTSKEDDGSLKTNLTRSGVAASGVDIDYISGLPWIVTEEFVDPISDEPFHRDLEDSVSAVHVRVDDGAQGRDGAARNILDTCPLVIDHPDPVVVSWLPQYHDMGLIGCYLYPALRGGTDLRLRADGLYSAPGAVVRRDHNLSGHRDGSAQLCLRLLPAGGEALQGEPGRLRSELAAGVDGGGGAGKAGYVHAVSGDVSAVRTQVGELYSGLRAG